jgi:hypothetical protein
MHKSVGKLFHQRLLVFGNIYIVGGSTGRIKKTGTFIPTTRRVTNKGEKLERN